MHSDSNNIVAAFTIEQAARLTGVSRRQLGTWARNGFFSPSLSYGERGPYARLYSFRDLLSLKVLHQLRNDTRVSMNHLKEVKRDLAHLGDDMWVKSTLYLLGKRVVIEPMTKAGMKLVPVRKCTRFHLRSLSAECGNAFGN